MTSLLAFAIKFCAAHVDVLVALLGDIAQYVDAHIAKIPNDPTAVNALQALTNDAAARAIATVSARAKLAAMGNVESA